MDVAGVHPRAGEERSARLFYPGYSSRGSLSIRSTHLCS